jgi:hypothetical protein
MRAVFVPAALALASVMLSISSFAPRAYAEDSLPAAPVAAGPAPVAVAAAEGDEARRHIETTLAHMRATSLRVRDDLRATRRRGTKRQLTCVDEALSRADVALRRARELGDEILAAYGRDDVDAARGARRRLAELHEAQRQAAMTAASCAPQPRAPALASATTTVKLQIDPNIAPAR